MTTPNPDLSELHADLFDIGHSFEIQKCDETAPDGYTDADALAAIIQAASRGNYDALLALYLDGRPSLSDDRNYWPENAKKLVAEARRQRDAAFSALQSAADAMRTCLPYIESAEADPAYDKGAVTRLTRKLCKAISQADAVVSLPCHSDDEPAADDDLAANELRAAARAAYATKNLQIDADAVISESNDGAWVQAWVWVPETTHPDNEDKYDDIEDH